jgi:CheY-like chemotaxis protein
MLERLRNCPDERARALPVVVMTSSTLKSDIDKAHELGANGYMTKPADYVGLLTAVGGILNTFLTVSPER